MHDPLATVRMLIQDGALDLDLGRAHGTGGQARWEAKKLVLPADRNDRFLDGPASRRIAVVDFDPVTGLAMPPAARFVPSRKVPTRGSFPDDGDPTSPATIAVNAFGTAFQTTRMFEGAEALGRQVEWAFGSEQLLVVPRAGQRRNAFYERATRSLQFFQFTAATGQTIYTALSRDIVSHECGHALLDAVAPSLYDSVTPQSIAIHEAVADQIAVLMALDSRHLRTGVLARSENSLAGTTAFSSIAVEFGRSTPDARGERRSALRDLANTLRLPDLARAKPHVLSTLLSGIFYDTLASIFAARFEVELDKPEIDGNDPQDRARASNKALGTAHVLFRRLLLRGIDYLPPGELAFADVGRAILAADRAACPDERAQRSMRRQRADFSRRFVDREVVTNLGDLDSPCPDQLGVAGAEGLRELRDSDWAAYAYIEQHREVLGIPRGSSFTVLPRVDSTKAIGPISKGARPTQRELIVKVGWRHLEDSPLAHVGASKRLVPTGVTVSLGWEDGRCLALVGSHVTSDEHRDERDEFVRALEHDGMLSAAHNPGPVELLVAGGVGRMSNTHRLLHLGDGDE